MKLKGMSIIEFGVASEVGFLNRADIAKKM